ncbi:hypothetical protein [Streptomyces diastaticus]
MASCSQRPPHGELRRQRRGLRQRVGGQNGGPGISAPPRGRITRPWRHRGGRAIGRNHKDKPNRVTFGETTVTLSTSLVDILRTRHSHIPSWYRISSGASHNTTWLVQQAAATSKDGTLSLRADPATIIAATLAVLGAYEDVTETFGTYFGHERTAGAVRTLQMRAQAMVDLGKKWRQQMEMDARQVLWSP